MISLLENSKWLDKVDETFSKQLQHVSKVFHQLFLTIYLPIHHYGIHNSGGPPKAAPTVVEAAEGRLHNGGWGDKWLDKVDETFLKHFAVVSKTFHLLDSAIHRCLDAGLPQTLNFLRE